MHEISRVMMTFSVLQSLFQAGELAQFQPDALPPGSSSPCFVGIFPTKVFSGPTCQDRSDSNQYFQTVCYKSITTSY